MPAPKLTVIPTRLELVVDDVFYPVTSVSLVFGSNTPAQAMCNLATGRSVRGNDAVPAPVFIRGTRAYINAYLQGGTESDGAYKVFEGVVDEGGPKSMFGNSFAVSVQLMGKSFLMDNGTLHTSSLLPSVYLDPGSTSEADAPGFNTEDLEAYNGDFGGAMVGRLIEMVNSAQGAAALDTPTANIMREFFGLEGNEAVLQTLSEVVADMQFGDLVTESIKVSILDYYSRLSAQTLLHNSFFARLTAMSPVLKYRLVELPSGIFLYPYSPFVPSQYCTTLEPHEYSGIGWNNAGVSQYVGCVLFGDMASINDVASFPGYYKRPGIPTGRILTTALPEPLHEAVSSELGEAIHTANQEQIESTRLGDAMARELCLEAAYGGRSLSVAMPYFRTDIGPLTALRIVYPETVDQAVGTEVYGSVRTVTLTLDATSRSASTTYDIGYVRSYEQQRREIDEDTRFAGVPHPVWAKNVYATNLNSAPTG